MTVSGFTIVRASAQRDHTRESTIQNARSIGRSRRRCLPTQDCKLLSERKVLGREVRLRSEGSTERAEDGHDEGEHGQTFAEVAQIVSGESGWAAR
jgi:hypothetical protein